MTTSAFQWVGKRKFKVALPAGEDVVVPLRACVAAAGVYDMQRVRVYASGDSAPAEARTLGPSLLTVTAGSE